MICEYCKKSDTCKRNKANVKTACELFEEDSEKHEALKKQVEEKRKVLEERFKGNPIADNLIAIYDSFAKKI